MEPGIQMAAVNDCKRKNCWCKEYPVEFSELYEAVNPLMGRIESLEEKVDILQAAKKSHSDSFSQRYSDLLNRIRSIETVIFSKNPHKCPICLGKRVIENSEVEECMTCKATGIVWG